MFDYKEFLQNKLGAYDWPFLSNRGVILPHTQSFNAHIDKRIIEKIGKEAIIWPGAFVLGDKTIIGEHTEIFPGAKILNAIILRFCKISGIVHSSILMDYCEIDDCSKVLKNSLLNAGTKIEYSIIENSNLGKSVTVGPFSWVKQGSVLGYKSSVGHHVLVSRSHLGRNVHVPHHAQVTDLDIDDDVNLARGFTHSNFNGLEKKRSKIGRGSFIGTDCNLNGNSILGNEVRTYPKIFVASKKPIPDHAWVWPDKIIENANFKIPDHQRWICFPEPVLQIHILKRFLRDTGKKFSDDSAGNQKMAEYVKAKLAELNLFSLKILEEAEIFGPEE